MDIGPGKKVSVRLTSPRVWEDNKDELFNHDMLNNLIGSWLSLCPNTIWLYDSDSDEEGEHDETENRRRRLYFFCTRPILNSTAQWHWGTGPIPKNAIKSLRTFAISTFSPTSSKPETRTMKLFRFRSWRKSFNRDALYRQTANSACRSIMQFRYLYLQS